MKALVIGGGISGLTTALSLEAIGIDVIIFEAAPTLRPLGLGLNLQPYAVRELEDLGLGAVIRRTGREITSLNYFNRHGQPVHREPTGLAAGFAWPQISIHRGILQMAMCDGFAAKQGQTKIRCGHRLVGVDERFGQAVAAFETQDGACVEAGADFIVGADGVGSAVRRALFGREPGPLFSGLTLWRAAVPYRAIHGGAAMIVAGNYAKRVVVYPIGEADIGSGMQLTNWIGVLRGEISDLPAEDWNAPGNRRHLLDAFGGWRFDWLDVPGMMATAETILRFPMVDRDPLESWFQGRFVLVGDAAHPIYPVGSNGASHAIVDGRALAYAIATSPDLPSAFRHYEAERAPILRNVAIANRAGGPDRILSVADMIAPQGFDDVELEFPQADRKRILDSYRSVAGLSPAQLNARHSYRL